RLARTLAEQLELPGPVRDGVGAAYEQWDGRGWPGTLKAGAIPVAARIAQLAEFTEVAHRVGGVSGATALARRRAGRQFDPALAERMLHQSGALARVGEIAVQHRERLDGSGYPRGLSGGAISRPARVLGAADAYASMREPRPHRPARPAEEAAAEMRRGEGRA